MTSILRSVMCRRCHFHSSYSSTILLETRIVFIYFLFVRVMLYRHSCGISGCETGPFRCCRLCGIRCGIVKNISHRYIISFHVNYYFLLFNKNYW